MLLEQGSGKASEEIHGPRTEQGYACRCGRDELQSTHSDLICEAPELTRSSICSHSLRLGKLSRP